MAETREPPNRKPGSGQSVFPSDTGRSDEPGDHWLDSPTEHTLAQPGGLETIKEDGSPDAQQLPTRSSADLSGDTLVTPNGQIRQLHTESWQSAKSTFTGDQPSKEGYGLERASQATFVTATSSRITGRWSSLLQRASIASYFTARSNTTSIQSPPPQDSPSSWLQHLKSLSLVPPPLLEQNWSGRGQHAEYAPSETSKIPLRPERVLGHSATALVESVRCRRIRLARKAIKCNYRLTREDAIKEVSHLQRLRHTHIIQVVGTYVQGKTLAILLYPVAEYSLDTFLEALSEKTAPAEEIPEMGRSLRKSFGCLATALHFIHANLTKHMDIKPKNILVKDMGPRDTAASEPAIDAYNKYKTIIADFGISHAYSSPLDADTESPTSYTKTYAAPEVVAQARRGFAADVFSLGCVYAELLAGFADSASALSARPSGGGPAEGEEPGISNAQDLLRIRLANPAGDASYQGNLAAVGEWVVGVCSRLRFAGYLLVGSHAGYEFGGLVRRMLDEDPGGRPEVAEVVASFGDVGLFLACRCPPAPDAFVAAES